MGALSHNKVRDIFDAFPNLRLAQEIDDLLVHCESMAELNKQLELLLKICCKHHLTLSPRKFQMCDENGSLIFAGYKLSAAGCEPNPDRMTAISDFPCPENRKQLQSLFGMITQFQAWAPNTATCHMRKLLSAKVAFTWTPETEKEFVDLKALLCSPLFLRPFDTSLETTFMVDTSSLEGTGFVLLQEDKEGKKRVVRCGSVTAKCSWARLSPIKAECIGLVWSAKSLDFYLCGCPSVKCVLDHQPLKTLMEAPLETLSPRMLRARLKLLQYRISYEWQPGRRMSLADALGRRPVYKSWVNLPDPLETLQQDSPLNHSISNVTGIKPFLGVEVTASIKEAIKSDDNYQEILKAVGSYMRKDISNLPAAHPAK